MQRNTHFARGFLIFLLLAGLCAGSVGVRVLDAEAAPVVAQLSPCATNPTIAKWTFAGDVTTPSTGSGTFASGSGLNPSPPFPPSVYSYVTGNPDRALTFTSWDTTGFDDTAFIEFKIDTTGRNSIGLTLDHRRSSTGPLNLQVGYSLDGINFVNFGAPIPVALVDTWHTEIIDFSSIVGLDNNPNTAFRIYGYAASGSGGTLRFDNVAFYCVPMVTVNQTSTQADPAGSLPVDFTVVFSQPINVSTFTAADIMQNGTATGITWVIVDSGDHVNFTLSATAVTGSGTIIPSIAANQVTDAAGYSNTSSSSTDNSVSYNDTTAPTVTINQATGQTDPDSTLPINFAVVFSEPITVNTFASTDIKQNGAATGITWNIADSGDHINFTLSATAVTGSGTLVPSIDADEVTDLVGNRNIASTSTDNTVTYTPTAATATTGPSAALTVLINEVAWAGTSSTRSGDEWIELYNTSSTPINLNGWTMTVDNGTDETELVAFGSNDNISGGGFFLLARPLTVPCDGTDDINIFTDVIEDKCFSTQLTNNPGQILRLYDAFDTLIDIANSDGGSWPQGSSSTYSSMERRGKILDSTSAWVTYGGTPFAHTRNNELVRGTPKRANWFTTITPTPQRTPTKRPTPRPPTPSGRPIINEFLPRPGFDWNQDGRIDVFDEFIEITNIGPVAITMNGWKLDDEEAIGSAPFTIPNMVLQPGQRAVFYGLETNILLSDGGDSVRLLNPSNIIFDAYTYGIVKVPDESWCRLPEGRDWWDDCVPTAGLPNTREGSVPSMPPGSGLQPPVCNFPDTFPPAFLIAECNPYGANIWNSMYWDEEGWQGDQYVPDNESKWQSFVE